LWGEGGSEGIRKKLKSEYTAHLESKYRRNDGESIQILSQTLFGHISINSLTILTVLMAMESP